MTGVLYAALTDLKPLLNITDTNQDSALTDTLDAASRAIDQDCNRTFYADSTATVTRKFIPDNQGFCIIDDLATFTSLTVQADTWTLDQDFYLEPQNAALDGFPYTAIRTIGRPFIYTKADTPSGWVGFDPRIDVEGAWGWPGSVPTPIKRATLILAMRLWERPKQAVFGMVGVGLDGAVVRSGGYDAEYEALVGPYRRRLWFG